MGLGVGASCITILYFTINNCNFFSSDILISKQISRLIFSHRVKYVCSKKIILYCLLKKHVLELCIEKKPAYADQKSGKKVVFLLPNLNDPRFVFFIQDLIPTRFDSMYK